MYENVLSTEVTIYLMRALMETGLLLDMERNLNLSFEFWTPMSSEHLAMRAGVIGSAGIPE
eukprot:5521184-Karenia_brevis.AAC.1